MASKIKSYPVRTCAQFQKNGACRQFEIKCRDIEPGKHDIFLQCPVKLFVPKGY